MEGSVQMAVRTAEMSGTSCKSAIGLALRLLRGQLQDPSPEELLWLAVIEHAVRDAYSSRASSDKVREDARRWLDSEYFDGVAVAIGLHPGWARDKIHQIPLVASPEDSSMPCQ